MSAGAPSTIPVEAEVPERFRDFCRWSGYDRRRCFKDLCGAWPGGLPGEGEAACYTVRQLMQAVFRLSRQRGFAAMGMRELSRQSGISLGGLYSWVDNKQQLAEVAVNHTRRIVLSGLLYRLEQHQSPRQALIGFVRGHLFLSERFREWFYFSYMEARAFSGATRERVQDVQGEAREWLSSVLHDGERACGWSAIDMALVADQVRALLQQWYVARGQFRARGVSVDDYCRACEQAVLRLTGDFYE